MQASCCLLIHHLTRGTKQSVCALVEPVAESVLPTPILTRQDLLYRCFLPVRVACWTGGFLFDHGGPCIIAEIQYTSISLAAAETVNNPGIHDSFSPARQPHPDDSAFKTEVSLSKKVRAWHHFHVDELALSLIVDIPPINLQSPSRIDWDLLL
jgi:hypothetical protein